MAQRPLATASYSYSSHYSYRDDEPPNDMNTAPGIRERIFSAADQLHESGGRQHLPTVDAVRKLAKVSMNDATTEMRLWRRALSDHATPPTPPVPEALQQSNAMALAALWNEAIAHANETLRVGHANWEAERVEMETLREQMAAAFELQGAELATAQVENARLKSELERLAAALNSALAEAQGFQREHLLARAAVKQAAMKVKEIRLRAKELRQELDRAHAAAAVGAAELAQLRHRLEDTETTARSELVQALEAATTKHAPMATRAGQSRRPPGKARARAKPDSNTPK